MLPKLAVLIERRLPRYPRYCGSCRPAVEQREAEEAAARRAEEAAFREYQNTVGADSVVAGTGKPKRTAKGRTPKLPAGPPPAYRAEVEQRQMSRAEQIAAAAREQAERDPDAHAVRGGFVPRPTPEQREFPSHSEMDNRKTEWTGTRVSALYHGG